MSLSDPFKNLRIRIDTLKSPTIEAKGIELSIGKIIEEWEEPLGPTPFPRSIDLRDWDLKLLKRYRPVYLPFCDVCCLCTFGKCDLSRNRRGACGIDMSAQQSRIVLLAAAIGAATHTSHAREIVEDLIKRLGPDVPFDLGVNIHFEAPILRLVCGIKPKTLADLLTALDYVESQIIQTLAATHTGQEGSNIDFESKIFHMGMLDHVALEIADMAQIISLGFPKGDIDAPLVDLGIGSIDTSKPVILCIGHNVIPSTSIIDYIESNGLTGSIEVIGLCCTAHDMTRYTRKAKIVGPISWQLKFIRTGIPDVIVVDEQCIRTDIPIEAKKIGAAVIATNPKVCYGFPDMTREDANKIVEYLISGRIPGALILNYEKVGEVAVKTALRLAPQRAIYKAPPDISDIPKYAGMCTRCRECVRACPNTLPIPEAMTLAARGDISKLANLYDKCIACGRCERECPRNIPILTMINKAAIKKMREERYRIRVGKGPITDVEIRNVGRDIVLGTIPGVIAFVGCANYAEGGREVAEMAQEFLRRNYIVVASGCSAMTIGMYKTDDGTTLYESFPGEFTAGGLVNVGSCVANSHIAGALIKIAAIFAKRRLRANYKEIADYIHNRVGACGIAWGAMSQKAVAIAAGFWRLGTPVIVGPHGSKYRRMLLGDASNEENWYVYDARTGERVYVGPVPEHLFYFAETKEEAMVTAVKLCMRAADTPQGRAIKLSHYIDLYKKFFGTLPPDIHLFVRTESDIPITFKEEVKKYLEKVGWKEKKVVYEPTLLEELIRGKEGGS